MRKNGWRLLLVLIAAAALVLAAGSALAGWNDVTVCTDGDGAPVYASSGASKKAGIMYNGYSSGIGLDEVNGRYEAAPRALLGYKLVLVGTVGTVPWSRSSYSKS